MHGPGLSFPKRIRIPFQNTHSKLMSMGKLIEQGEAVRYKIERSFINVREIAEEPRMSASQNLYDHRGRSEHRML
jgi:hypothetical protein